MGVATVVFVVAFGMVLSWAVAPLIQKRIDEAVERDLAKPIQTD